MNNKKIMIVSSKGGVGKSTVSMQVIAPYLYQHNNKEAISYYEFDEENNDSLSFADSKLTNRIVGSVSSPMLKEELAEIISKDENACFDIGGNKSTSIVLEALEESGMISFIDLAIIPLLEGEQDGINACITYSVLKGMKKDLNIMFMLNRARDLEHVEYQFDNYFGDLRGFFHDKYAIKNYLIDDEIDSYGVLIDDDVIKYSRKFGLTIYEIAKQDRDFVSEMIDHKEKGSDKEELKLLSFKNYINKNSTKYYVDVLIPIFKKMDTLLGVIK
ncbi:Mrp/NBP35 family ATP-binding protein [Sulfurimonas sp.]|nr:Mrp/NBP35 family ATP-binding protein [Sulfurimonas sp.]